jgi:aminobenzoyl-glutamate utilization protein B
VTATARTDVAHEGMLRAAEWIAATVMDLLTQPTVLAQVQEEFAQRTARTRWYSLIPDGTQPPLFQPPDWFLRETNQAWPPAGIAWPPPRFVSRGQYGTTGPRL